MRGYIRRGIEVVITGLTRNFLKSWLFAPLNKPVNSGFSPVRKLNILLFFPSVLSKSFWKKCGITYTESCPSGRRCSTRNDSDWKMRSPVPSDTGPPGSGRPSHRPPGQQTGRTADRLPAATGRRFPYKRLAAKYTGHRGFFPYIN